jgi:hypothetical protein
MSLKVRKGIEPASLLKTVALAFNALREAVVSTNIHYDITRAAVDDPMEPTLPDAIACSTVAATNAATAVTLVNDVKHIYDRHAPDTYAHGTTASASITIANATDVTTGIALANNILTVYAAHRTASNVHATNDTVNLVTAATCTNTATLITLVNDEVTHLNAHITAGLAGAHLEPIDP